MQPIAGPSLVTLLLRALRWRDLHPELFGVGTNGSPRHVRARALFVGRKKGEAAKRFAGSHLRSAMTTHELEQGKNIIGIQYRVGHKLLSTTSRYVKPSFRAALETVAPVVAAPPQNQNLGVRLLSLEGG